jgi:hypothetical protein
MDDSAVKLYVSPQKQRLQLSSQRSLYQSRVIFIYYQSPIQFWYIDPYPHNLELFYFNIATSLKMNSKTTSDFFSDRVSTSSAKEKRIILNQLRNVWNEELIDFSHQIVVEEYLDHLSTHLLEAEA